MNSEKEIYKILSRLKRAGIMDLWTEYKGKYLTSPASSKYHGSYEGGLAVHSLMVFKIFRKLLDTAKIILSYDTIVLCCLFHDLCKVDVYIMLKNEIIKNPMALKGHALLSIYRISRFVYLTELEKDIIKYHMGIFGLDEYSLEELQRKTNENHVLMLFHCADMLASRLEKRFKIS